MRIPDINRLIKAKELLQRAEDNFDKVADNLFQADEEKGRLYREVQAYSQEVNKMQNLLKYTIKYADSLISEKDKKKYYDKFCK